MNSKTLGILSLVAVFLIGAVLGIVLGYLFEKPDHHHHNKEDMVAKFKKDLDLNAEQEKVLLNLLDELKQKYAALRKKHRPEYKAIQKEFRTSFKQILTPEQQKKFDAYLKEKRHD
jgi:uncharacterized protein HemX